MKISLKKSMSLGLAFAAVGTMISCGDDSSDNGGDTAKSSVKPTTSTGTGTSASVVTSTPGSTETSTPVSTPSTNSVAPGSASSTGGSTPASTSSTGTSTAPTSQPGTSTPASTPASASASATPVPATPTPRAVSISNFTASYTGGDGSDDFQATNYAALSSNVVIQGAGGRDYLTWNSENNSVSFGTNASIAVEELRLKPVGANAKTITMSSYSGTNYYPTFTGLDTIKVFDTAVTNLTIERIPSLTALTFSATEGAVTHVTGITAWFDENKIASVAADNAALTVNLEATGGALTIPKLTVGSSTGTNASASDLDNGFATLNIVSSSGTDTNGVKYISSITGVDVASSRLTTIGISGTGSVTLGGLGTADATNVTTVTSTTTGSVVLNYQVNAGKTNTISLGSGDDTVTVTNANNLTTNGSILLGGGADTLTLDAVLGAKASLVGGDGVDTLTIKETDLSSNTLGSVSQFEVLDFGADIGAETVTLSTVTPLNSNWTGIKFSTAAQTGNVTVGGLAGSNVTVNFAATYGDGADTLTLANASTANTNDTVTFLSSNATPTHASATVASAGTDKLIITQTTANGTYGKLNMSSLDSITITSDTNGESGTNYKAVTISDLTDVANSITLTSAENLTISAVSDTNTTTINGAAVSGSLTIAIGGATTTTNTIAITGGSSSNTVTGSTGSNVLKVTNTSSSLNVVTGNGGADQITLYGAGPTRINLAGVIAAANRNVINGFKLGGTDKICVATAETTAGTLINQNAAWVEHTPTVANPNTSMSSYTDSYDVIEVLNVSANLAADFDTTSDARLFMSAVTGASNGDIKTKNNADKVYIIGYDSTGYANVYYGDAGAGNNSIAYTELIPVARIATKSTAAAPTSTSAIASGDLASGDVLICQ